MFGCSGSGHLGHHCIAMHHRQPVTQANQLQCLARCDQHRAACIGEVTQEPIDFQLGPHINPARRLLDHQQLHIARQITAQKYLLLVAA